jgi:hypothetical protein
VYTLRPLVRDAGVSICPAQRCGSSYQTIESMARRSPVTLIFQNQPYATRRRAQGATLDELARSYNVGISTIRRATRLAA